MRTDEAISALEMVAGIAPLLITDTYRWKWVVLSTHNALQGFMVLALRHGNGLLALKDEIAAQWLEAYKEGGTYPDEKLDNFFNLYNKVKSDRMQSYVNAKRFEPTPDHNWTVEKLNKLRNELIYPIP